MSEKEEVKIEEEFVFKKWRLLGYDLRPDYTLYIYPVHVWATNRILHTMISRDMEYYKKGAGALQRGRSPLGLFRDVGHITRLYGPAAFFNGITAYTINHVLNNWEIFGDPDAEFKDENGQYWFYCTILLWNPLNILIVRMQCLEFPYKKLRYAFTDMVKNDGYRMFYRGLFPIFTA